MTTANTILVLYTGGTLGMIESAHGLRPAGDFEARLRLAISRLPASRGDGIPPFEMLEYATPIDSSSATPADWQRLARDIATRHADYAGFVVLHGTDTLAWTASSLAFQLLGIDKPVVVTGAQKPLEAPGSDALGNIETALRFAALPGLAEVTVAFAGKLMRGCRSRKWDTHAFDGFASPNWPLLGECIDGAPVLYPSRLLSPSGAPRFELPDLSTASSVVRLALWPGIQARQVATLLDEDSVRGAVLECWGSGNMPDDPHLAGALVTASGAGKLLAVVSQCPHGPVALETYASGQALGDAGVLAGDDMTPEAAFTKLTHVLAQPLTDAQRRHRFLSPLCGERSALA
ncbi:asparaginase [Chromohalobacter israelensis]